MPVYLRRWYIQRLDRAYKEENEAIERETPFQKLVAKCARYLLSHIICV